MFAKHIGNFDIRYVKVNIYIRRYAKSYSLSKLITEEITCLSLTQLHLKYREFLAFVFACWLLEVKELSVFW